ncbi:MAG: flagellar M-ring protein FliF C-terminal domain-containing protein, partial [Alphaproteobacteria bacterium]
DQYRTAIVVLLEKAVGMGKVAAQVAAEVNTDVVQENSEIYDPTQQVVRSEQTSESASTNSTGASGGQTGVQANTPDGGAGGASGGGGGSENRTETTTNYEVGKTIRQLTKNGGEVKKLSVAVMVEGKTTENANGEPVYTPYTEAQITQFRQLVQTAVGYNAERGDTVTVVDMQFSTPPEAPALEEPFMTKDQMLQFAHYGLLIVALLVVGLIVVKPTLNLLIGALSTPSAPAPLPPMQTAGPLAMGAPMMEDSGVDVRSIQGRVKESAVKKVNEIIDQHPEESLNLVRGWMAQSDRRSSNNGDES